MKIPESDITIESLIDKHHESIAEPPRPHMGASTLGHPCDRWLWLSFRWAVRPVFPGRILRLFRRGHIEEATIVADLRAIGMDVRNATTHQHRIDFGGHVSGSLDAIIESGVPGAIKTRHIAEFKTHSKKSFDALLKGGVVEAKPEHHIQMQVYMHGTKIERALYVAVCKDDDRMHTERIHYDKAVAEKAIARGHRLALAERLPEPISADPSWYQCGWCSAHEFCHLSHQTLHANCRTCAHATALPDSTWRCERHQADGIPEGYQRTGCDDHVLHPDLVPWPIDADASTDIEAVYIIEDKPVRNGRASGGVFASSEIIANPSACAHADDFIASVREEMGGRVVG